MTPEPVSEEDGGLDYERFRDKIHSEIAGVSTAVTSKKQINAE